MITLLTKKDLSDLEDERLHPHIARYLQDYFSHMLTQFNCEDISPYGGIMYLENSDDVSLFDSMKMRSSMRFDTAVRLVLEEKTEFMQILYNYYGKAVIVFAVPEIAEPIVEKECCKSARRMEETPC